MHVAITVGHSWRVLLVKVTLAWVRVAYGLVAVSCSLLILAIACGIQTVLSLGKKMTSPATGMVLVRFVGQQRVRQLVRVACPVVLVLISRTFQMQRLLLMALSITAMKFLEGVITQALRA